MHASNIGWVDTCLLWAIFRPLLLLSLIKSKSTAPFFFQIVLYFPTFTFKEFPLMFMGSCAALGGLLALLLPETLGSPLVESVADVDRMDGARVKSFFSWWGDDQLRRKLEKNRSGRRQQQLQQ